MLWAGEAVTASETATRYDVCLADGMSYGFDAAEYRVRVEGGVLLICRRRPDIICRGDNAELVSAYAASVWSTLPAITTKGRGIT